jgi:hypothetical protein
MTYFHFVEMKKINPKFNANTIIIAPNRPVHIFTPNRTVHTFLNVNSKINVKKFTLNANSDKIVNKTIVLSIIYSNVIIQTHITTN